MAHATRSMTGRFRPQQINNLLATRHHATRCRSTSTISHGHKIISYNAATTVHPPYTVTRLELTRTFNNRTKAPIIQTISGTVFQHTSSSGLQQWKSLHSSSRLQASERPTHDKTNTPNSPSTAEKQSILTDLNSAGPQSTGKIVPTILSKITTTQKHENIYTLPNFLTTTRIITAPIISYALLHSQPVLAMTLFTYSSITDWVDGYLARRYNSGTVLGSILDPFADKLLMTLTTITLYSIGTFPWWLTLIILGRDGGLALSALYFRWISLPEPRTMMRYWDFSLPSAEVRPTEISKINTMLQFLLVANALLLPVLPVGWVEAGNLYGVFEGWMMLVAGTTVWSGASYLFTKDAIRFIGRER